MRYCMDCEHYIPGGVDHNCRAISRPTSNTVSALKGACSLFGEKESEEQTAFAPIKFRRLKRKRK